MRGESYSDSRFRGLADSASKQPYGYTRIDGKTYALQATFDLPTPAEDEQQPWNRDDSSSTPRARRRSRSPRPKSRTGFSLSGAVTG